MKPARTSERIPPGLRRLALLLIAACLLSSCRPTTSPVSNSRQAAAEIDAALNRAVLNRSRHVLLSIDAPFIDLTYRGAAGLARVDTKEPITADWQFYTASVSKVMTAVIIHQMAEEGAFGPRGVDAPLAALNALPPEVIAALHRIHGVSYGDSLTLRHLLNHTSGLRDLVFDGLDNPVALMPGTAEGAAPDSLVGLAVFDEKLGLTPLVQCKLFNLPTGCNPQDYLFSHRWIIWDYPAWQTDPKNKMAGLLNFYLAGMNDHALFEPGKGFHYSDTNYLILALVIEQLSGNSLHHELRARIFDPLEMNDTYLIEASDPPSQTYAKRLADVWAWNEPCFSGGVNFSFERGGGGIVSTLADLRTFARALTAGRLFQKDGTLNDMLTVPTGIKGIFYASGLIVFPTGQGPVLYSMGSNGAWIEYFPPQDLLMIGTTDDFSDMPGQFMLHGEISQLLAKHGLPTPMARLSSWPMLLMMICVVLTLLLDSIWLIKGLLGALRRKGPPSPPPDSLKLARWLTFAAFLATLALLALIANTFSENIFQMLFGFSPQVRNLFTIAALVSGAFTLAITVVAARLWRRSEGPIFDRSLLTALAILTLLYAFSLAALSL